MSTYSMSSIRAHLDVHAMIQDLRAHRGRSQFRVSQHRDASVDGCFSRYKAHTEPFVDRPQFAGCLRANVPVRSQGIATRSTSMASHKSTATHESVHAFPFRSSSRNPGVPEREWITPTHRSPSVHSAVPEEATVLLKREVNRRSLPSGVVAEVNPSLRRSCRLRYAAVASAGNAAKRRPLAVHHATGTTPKKDPTIVPAAELWLRVSPQRYTALGVPPAARTLIASFLPTAELQRLTTVCTEFAAANKAAAQQHALDAVCAMPRGYFDAMVGTEAEEVPDTTMLLATLVVTSVDGNCTDQQLPPSLMWSLWKELLLTQDCYHLMKRLVTSDFAQVGPLIRAARGTQTEEAWLEKCDVEDGNAAVVLRWLAALCVDASP